MKKHPYLKQDQFRDPTFLRIRRQVWLLLLPYTEGEDREETLKLIALYDELIG